MVVSPAAQVGPPRYLFYLQMVIPPVDIPGEDRHFIRSISSWWSHLPVFQVEPPFYLFSLLMVVPPVDIPGEGNDFIRSISSGWSHLSISQMRVATLV